MKKLIFPIAIAVFFAGTVSAQDELFSAKLKKEDVPAEVLTAVAEDYGDGIIVTEYKALPIELMGEGWVVRTNPDNAGKDYDSYQIDFTSKNMKGKAVYDAKGNLISASERINDAVLPRPVQKSIDRDFPGWMAAKDQEMITIRNRDEDKVYYKLKMTKGNEKEWVTYSADGNIAKAEKSHEMLLHKDRLADRHTDKLKS
ncbi:MAG: hypothetical protein GC192_12155 [Bacteroidetes bacterium]|nr:hypothetical protein [Bacteroidota bacterium]